MKRPVILFLMLCCLILLSACAKQDWGIALTAENVTPEGLTLICSQSGGDYEGRLQTGLRYYLQKKTFGLWVDVPYIIPESEVGWRDIGLLILHNDQTEWEVDWSELYGSLESGEYRICKEIKDYHDTNDYDKQVFYAEFTIE